MKTGRVLSDQIDPVLAPFLEAGEARESEHLLERLICDHASPVIKQVVRRKMRLSMLSDVDSWLHQEAEDISSHAIVSLITRLRELKSKPESRSIGEFTSYVAAISNNACNQHLRRKYPQRHSLKNKLRYLLTHRPQFSIWDSADGELLCGETTWRIQQAPPATGGEINAIRSDPRIIEREAFLNGSESTDISRVAFAVIAFLARPIELDDLVSIVAEISGIKDSFSAEVSDAADNGLLAADSQPSLEASLEHRSYLSQLWIEIVTLPLRQRLALLLNLKDTQGGNGIALFSVIGIASIRQIAAVLEMTAAELAELWNQLPLEDSLIAERLGGTRQQVINLRKCARERLARRMRSL